MSVPEFIEPHSQIPEKRFSCGVGYRWHGLPQNNYQYIERAREVISKDIKAWESLGDLPTLRQAQLLRRHATAFSGTALRWNAPLMLSGSWVHKNARDRNGYLEVTFAAKFPVLIGAQKSSVHYEIRWHSRATDVVWRSWPSWVCRRGFTHDYQCAEYLAQPLIRTIEPRGVTLAIACKEIEAAYDNGSVAAAKAILGVSQGPAIVDVLFRHDEDGLVWVTEVVRKKCIDTLVEQRKTQSPNFALIAVCELVLNAIHWPYLESPHERANASQPSTGADIREMALRLIEIPVPKGAEWIRPIHGYLNSPSSVPLGLEEDLLEVLRDSSKKGELVRRIAATLSDAKCLAELQTVLEVIVKADRELFGKLAAATFDRSNADRALSFMMLELAIREKIPQGEAAIVNFIASSKVELVSATIDILASYRPSGWRELLRGLLNHPHKLIAARSNRILSSL